MKKKILELLLVLLVSGLVFVSCAGRDKELSFEETDGNESSFSAIDGEDLKGSSEVDKEETTSFEAEGESGGCIYVYVCGCVPNPGVYEMESGSRVFEAVEKAGGFSEDACKERVNLAEECTDKEMIVIPSVFEEDSESDDGLVNINTAGKDSLMSLPGVGESRAEAIISYREEHGFFEKEEDLMLVSGIKEASFSKLKGKIKVQN